MNYPKHTLAAFAISVVILTLASPVWSSNEESTPALSDIQISFKLDPRLTRGDQMGDRWVSPKVYMGTAAQDTVEAGALGIDAKGKPVRISPEWIPSDPEMVTVSPKRGDAVNITVKHAGEASLEVVYQGYSKRLPIKALDRNNALQVEIAQLEMKAPAGAPPATAAQETPAFQSQKEKRSYALGVQMANIIRQQAIEVDSEIYSQGFKDAVSSGQMLMKEGEIRSTLSELQDEMKKKRLAVQAEQRKDIAEKNKQQGEKFLAENKTKEGIITLESGLQYKVLKAGDGKKPTVNDQVVCHYRAAFIDGKEFDSSYKRHQPAVFPVGKLMQGWTEALLLMPAGSKWQLFIPPSLAYGERGARKKVGPNQTLIFEVELISIKDAAETEAPKTAASEEPNEILDDEVAPKDSAALAR
jgi:FKBP-type peptidyl-prolyl cis-trans isomerase FklB